MLVPSTPAVAEAVGQLTGMLCFLAAPVGALGAYLWTARKRALGGVVLAATFSGPVILAALIAAARLMGSPPALGDEARMPLAIETGGPEDVVRHAGLGVSFRVPRGFAHAPPELRETAAAAFGGHEEQIHTDALSHPDGGVILVVVAPRTEPEHLDAMAQGMREGMEAGGAELLEQEIRGVGMSREIHSAMRIQRVRADSRTILVPSSPSEGTPFTLMAIGLEPAAQARVLDSLRVDRAAARPAD